MHRDARMRRCAMANDIRVGLEEELTRLKMEHEATLETLLVVQKECMRLERENKALRKERDEWKAAARGLQ
jgi:hypothetical protein